MVKGWSEGRWSGDVVRGWSGDGQGGQHTVLTNQIGYHTILLYLVKSHIHKPMVSEGRAAATVRSSALAASPMELFQSPRLVIEA